MRNRGVLLAALAVMLLMGVSPLAADPVIKHGIDAFTTTANGRTYYDFAKNPIPAGFFCAGSAPFTGRIVLRGLPLETGTHGQLRGADTVIERLDDAVFGANNTAVTRLQFRALSLVSIAPLQTACGAFHVYVSLADKQRVTKMTIYRTGEGGGSFVAPLAVNARMTFIPVKPPTDKSPRKLELTGSFTFPATPIPWSLTGGAATKRIGSVVVDTNGDLIPDTRLSGTSNFFPGWSPKGEGVMAKGCTMCEPQVCHDDSGEQHCTGPTYACYPYNCP